MTSRCVTNESITRRRVHQQRRRVRYSRWVACLWLIVYDALWFDLIMVNIKGKPIKPRRVDCAIICGALGSIGFDNVILFDNMIMMLFKKPMSFTVTWVCHREWHVKGHKRPSTLLWRVVYDEFIYADSKLLELIILCYKKPNIMYDDLLCNLPPFSARSSPRPRSASGKPYKPNNLITLINHVFFVIYYCKGQGCVYTLTNWCLVYFYVSEAGQQSHGSLKSWYYS